MFPGMIGKEEQSLPDRPFDEAAGDIRLMARALDYLERVKEVYADRPGFASNVGLNGFNYVIEDLQARLKK